MPTYFLSFLSPQTIAVVNSRFNKKIMVEFYKGKYRTVVDRYWQSGSYAEHILNRGLTNVDLKPKSILILGLGCGSMARVLTGRFPKAKMAGVEIDPQMIEIGEKYFHLGETRELKIVIEDAYDFVMKKRAEYDMIVSDLFIGCDTPPKLLSERYIKGLQRLLDKNGIYICNCSYNTEHKEQTDRFLTTVRKVFPHVRTIQSGPNLIFQAYPFKNSF